MSYENHQAACDHCRDKKIRCDKGKPQCSVCLDRGIECHYGFRLKRGPKAKPNNTYKTKKVIFPVGDQLQNVPKSNNSFHDILFELEFNRKLTELWKKMYGKTTLELMQAKKPRFFPETEAFIKSPDALKTMFDEFDSEMKYHFTLPSSFAQNMDLAQKIWTAIIEVQLPDLLPILSEFQTELLVSTLEYLAAFLMRA